MWNRECISPQKLGLLAAGFLFLMQLSTAAASTLLRGENRTCRDFADLDYALDHPGSLYFKGWRTEDFDAAQAWVEGCLSAPPTKGDLQRQSLLAQSRTAMEGRGEIRRNDESAKQFHDEEVREQQENDANLKVQESARRADEADRRAKQQAHEQCLRSDAYQRYVAGIRVLEALDRESQAQQALDHEKRVEAASGTTNLYTKRNAGESLVAAQEDLAKSWSLYQRYGGSAKNPHALSRSMGNPCN